MHPPAASPTLPVADLRTLFGRDEALTQTAATLSEVRLLTLTGAAGAGKSRLAIHLADRVQDRYPDGVWIVDLAGRGGGTSVAQSVAGALEIREIAGATIEASLAESLRVRRLLLVLDECESALDETRRLLGTLLAGCPSLTVLATSREPLGVEAEAVYRVSALPTPLAETSFEPEGLDGYASVRLFVDRVAAHEPRFALSASNAATVAEVCRTLGGSPLALEIAAARVPAMTVESVSESILAHGRSEATTLEGLIDWSYELLAPDERALLRAAGVFVGGWTADAALAVARVPAKPDDLLGSLVERSLVQRDPTGRYRLLETVRQHAWGRAERSGEGEALRAAHAGHYLNWVEEPSGELFGPLQIDAANRIEAERDNLRAALAYLVRAADAERAQRLVARLATFWETRGLLGEGAARGEEALALGRTPARLAALLGVARLSFLRSDPKAYDRYAEALRLARTANDLAAEAEAEQGLGNVLFWRREIPAAEAHFQEAYVLRQEIDDPAGVAACLHSLGNVRLRDGRLAEAEGLFERALAMRRERGDVRGITLTLGALSQLAVAREDDAAVVRLVREVVIRLSELRLRWALALNLTSLIQVAERRADPVRAALLAGARTRVRETTGFPVPEAERADLVASLDRLRRACGAAAYDAAYAEGYAHDWDGAVALVRGFPSP